MHVAVLLPRSFFIFTFYKLSVKNITLNIFLFYFYSFTATNIFYNIFYIKTNLQKYILAIISKNIILDGKHEGEKYGSEKNGIFFW